MILITNEVLYFQFLNIICLKISDKKTTNETIQTKNPTNKILLHTLSKPTPKPPPSRCSGDEKISKKNRKCQNEINLKWNLKSLSFFLVFFFSFWFAAKATTNNFKNCLDTADDNDIHISLSVGNGGVAGGGNAQMTTASWCQEVDGQWWSRRWWVLMQGVHDKWHCTRHTGA